MSTIIPTSKLSGNYNQAKKSIAGFSIRKGMGAPIGVSVTLRGARMYEFMDRLIAEPDRKSVV